MRLIIANCAVENTPVTAIVVHGTNYAVRVYEQDDGSFKNRHDVSVALTDMISNCIESLSLL
jgi:hypothetical protein